MNRSFFALMGIAAGVLFSVPAALANPGDPPPPPAMNANPPAPPAGNNSGTTLTGQVNNLQMGMGQNAPAPAAQAPQAAMPQGKMILGSTDSDWQGISADITELKRTSGDTVTLKFTINNTSGDDLDFGYTFGDSGTNDIGNIGGTHLIDATNKKKYFVVRDTDKKCLCSNGLKSVPPGGKSTLWAKFPAPPVGVNKITVEIPHFIPVEDVPIG